METITCRRRGGIIMFCMKCGKQIPDNAGFCPECGAQLTGLQDQQSMPRMRADAGTPQPPAGAGSQPEKKKKGKLPLIIAGAVAVIAVFAVIGGSSSGEKDSTVKETEAKEESTEAAAASEAAVESSAPVSGRSFTALEFYQDCEEMIGSTDSMSIDVTQKAYDFIRNHDDLFPSADGNIDAGLIDMSIDYRSLNKNISRYGDRLVVLPELGVNQIFETEYKDGAYLTEINTVDINGQQYYILYNGELPDVFEEDVISVTGLPLGTGKFSNTEGGETLVIYIAPCQVLSEGAGTAGMQAPPAAAGTQTQTPPANAGYTTMAGLSGDEIQQMLLDAKLSADEYILPTVDREYLPESMFQYFSDEDLRLAINEVYARHGRQYQSEDLNRYFSGKTWYRGTVPADVFSESVFNTYEKSNVDMMAALQNARKNGGTYSPAGAYEYLHTEIAGGPTEYYSKAPLLVTENGDGTLTVEDGYESFTMYPEGSGRWSASFSEGYASLEGVELSMEYGDGADIYLKK